MNVTWKPLHRPVPARAALPDSAFAFPAERKEPLTDASRVRSAVARFAQVSGVSDSERGQAFANIKAAAAYFGVTVGAKSWHDLVALRLAPPGLAQDDRGLAHPGLDEARAVIG
ncbi:MAG: hypothetical protein JO160_06685 [Candidatus Eremiobacteraeota bacterium]|nr:hypothetical protein [Candidatus Eremiobacteraeota bacterium]